MHFFKDYIESILSNVDIDFSDKKIEIQKDNKILQPLLEFRNELDSWGTFTEVRVNDYRNRILKYFKNTFGIEENIPKAGQKFNKKNQQTIKVELSNNISLDNSIKEILMPGYEINDELYSYYECAKVSSIYPAG